MKKRKGMTYKQAGVDIKAGEDIVEYIKRISKGTLMFAPGEILSGIGGFSAAIRLKGGLILILSTDGVGTKLLIAIIMGKQETVGIDLVAMCINDIIVINATPAFFLDYFVSGKLSSVDAPSILRGIVQGCIQAQCALVGGETAECPGMYPPGDYDLAGFAVGIANSRDQLILGDQIKPDMNVFGIVSNGLHSNGYSLVRRVLDINIENRKQALKKLEQYHHALECTLGEELLKPTRIYVKHIKELLGDARNKIPGMSHITGGGLNKNPIRILSSDCAMKITKDSWPIPRIFGLLQEKGGISDHEMRNTFNCGLGIVGVSEKKIVHPSVYNIGRIVSHKKGQKRIRFV